MGLPPRRREIGGDSLDARRARLERALDHAALLVDRQGEAFLPIFERLERELAALSEKTDVIGRARARAAQSAMR